MNHKLKFILTFLIGLAALFHVQQAHATCSNYTDYADGQVLTSSSLDSLQTNYTNCINDILNGDTFTGNMSYHAADALIYSDTGTTLTIQLDASEGSIIGAPQMPGTYGLGLSLSGGVLTITCNNTTCSSSNPGYVVMSSTTAGQLTTITVDTAFSFNDDANASSDLTNFGFGITETADWDEDAPFFIHAVNRSNSDADGSDGSSSFFISRDPTLVTTSSSANDIGDTGAVAATDSQNAIMIMQDVTVANYVSLPTLLIGAIRMQWSTTTDDWTVQTLGQSDGIGEFALSKTFQTVWVMPDSQNGAASGKYIKDNSGTAPSFSTSDIQYTLDKNGWVDFQVELDTISAGGSGSVGCYVAMPYSESLIVNSNINMNGSFLINSGVTGVLMHFPRRISNNTSLELIDSSANTLQNADFAVSGTIRGAVRFKAF